MYTITLADGRQLTELEINGSNYVSKDRVDESIFDGNLTTMIVDNGERTETYMDMVFIQQMELNGEYYLAFRPKTQHEKDTEKMNDMETMTDELVLMMAELIGG